MFKTISFWFKKNENFLFTRLFEFFALKFDDASSVFWPILYGSDSSMVKKLRPCQIRKTMNHSIIRELRELLISQKLKFFLQKIKKVQKWPIEHMFWWKKSKRRISIFLKLFSVINLDLKFDLKQFILANALWEKFCERKKLKM